MGQWMDAGMTKGGKSLPDKKNATEYRIKKTAKKEYIVFINDTKDKHFMNLDLALEYIKKLRGANNND